MSPITVLAVASALVAIATPGSALRCWTCDSQNDFACDDPFRGLNRYALVECENRGSLGQYYQGYPVCKKIRQRQDGRALVIRSCGWVDPNDIGRSPCNSQSNYGGYFHQEYCSVCNTDACNSAPRPSFAAPLLIPFAAPLAVLAAWFRR